MSKYSQRSLTYSADRLPGISGAAARFKDALQCRYLAGMWETRMLPADLCWFAFGCDNQPPEYLAPTWSWASVMTATYPFHLDLEYRGLIRFDSEITVLDVQCEVRGLNPFGRVSGGHLRVRGKVVDAHLQGTNVDSIQNSSLRGAPTWGVFPDCLLAPGPGGGIVRTSEGPHPSTFEGPVMCLFVGTTITSHITKRSDARCALVLVPSPADSSAFCRIALATSPLDGPPDTLFHGAEEREVLIL